MQSPLPGLATASNEAPARNSNPVLSTGTPSGSGGYCALCHGLVATSPCPQHGVATVVVDQIGRAQPELTPGILLAGRYRIDAVLGEGSSGRVYAATQLSLSREVAIKVLKRPRGGGPIDVARLHREALVVSRLNSPNVVLVYDFEVDAPTGIAFLVLERLAGRTLAEELLASRALPIARALALTAQIAEGIAVAHAEGLLHRDLKPANVFVSGDVAKVMDFGLAFGVGPQSASSSSGVAEARGIGTPLYMAPEQVLGGALGPETDLYGLGCILHEALAGCPPFVGAAARDAMALHVSGQAPTLPTPLPHGEQAPAGLIRLHRALLGKNPEDRPRSAAEVALALRSILSELESSAGVRARPAALNDAFILAETEGAGLPLPPPAVPSASSEAPAPTRQRARSSWLLVVPVASALGLWATWGPDAADPGAGAAPPVVFPVQPQSPTSAVAPQRPPARPSSPSVRPDPAPLVPPAAHAPAAASVAPVERRPLEEEQAAARLQLLEVRTRAVAAPRSPRRRQPLAPKPW